MNKKLLCFLLVIGLAVVGMLIGNYYMFPKEIIEAQKVDPIPCPARRTNLHNKCLRQLLYQS